MDAQHVNYRSWQSETQRNVVADSDEHMMNGRGVILKRSIFAKKNVSDA
jgi:hypothetical protein